MGNVVFPVLHVKTGHVYMVLGAAENCTNGNEGQRFIIYARNDKTFCREANEFWQKFERIDADKVVYNG